MKLAAVVLACAWSGAALAIPPAPVVTVHASGIKKLTFEWEPVAGASRYDLWFKASDNAAWTRYLQAPAPRSSFTTGVAVHLLNWPQARFQLKACDNSGCSTSNTVRVDSEKTVAMGYFKPEAPSTGSYGGNVALSADGATMAVEAQETVNGRENIAVIYVYRRTASTWKREARLVPNSAQSTGIQPFIGDPIALSGAGNLLVVGSWNENRRIGTVTRLETGAVYLFRRAGSVWRFAQKLVEQEIRPFDHFGYVVKIDDAGQTLAIAHEHEGLQDTRGTFEIFRDPADDGSDGFVHSTRVPVLRSDGIPHDCESAALSGDGNSLLRACIAPSTGDQYVQSLETAGFTETGRFPVLDTNGVDVSRDGTRAVVNEFREGHAFRLVSGAWVDDGALTSFGGSDGGAHRKVAISRDGRIAAVGSILDRAAGLGPIFEPYFLGADANGAVVVHERKNNGWVIRRLVKPGSTNRQWAGHTVALGDNGNVLAVGAPLDASAASGIDGDRDDDSSPNRGAVWLY